MTTDMQIDLSKPGRRYVHDRGKYYIVYGHKYGLEIERLADGATVFFQDDDIDALELDLEGCRTVADIDRVCADYDNVMETEAERN